MEPLPENHNRRKRNCDKGTMDTQMVVEDLENTISSLASYLSSNTSLMTTSSNESPTQNCHSQQIPSPLCQVPLPVHGLASDGVQSPCISHTESLNSKNRQTVSQKRTDSPSGAFRPISPPGSTHSSPLITASIGFNTLSEDVPPPLPKRGPPVRSSPNPDIFALPSKACVQTGPSLVTSPASPYPSERSTEFIDTRDRHQVSSVISKTSSDIELFNLYRCDKHSDQRQIEGESESNLGPLSEEQILSKGRDSEMTKTCIVLTDKCTTNNEEQVDEIFKDATSQSSVSHRTTKVSSGENGSELEHHYSEIDLYTPSNERDSATVATDLDTTASNGVHYIAPSVSLHAEG
ncbi:uncharacterized protein [Palaemon carinicauda]|uniref:uncharacterized protein n=1 Tax=Palaemon carinicauda TaxID=392227 RepID=UPI0035B6099D